MGGGRDHKGGGGYVEANFAWMGCTDCLWSKYCEGSPRKGVWPVPGGFRSDSPSEGTARALCTLRPSGVHAMQQNMAHRLEAERRGDLQRHTRIGARGCSRTHMPRCAARTARGHPPWTPGALHYTSRAFAERPAPREGGDSQIHRLHTIFRTGRWGMCSVLRGQ